MEIKMLISLGTATGSYVMGETLVVGDDITVERAKEFIDKKLAKIVSGSFKDVEEGKPPSSISEGSNAPQDNDNSEGDKQPDMNEKTKARYDELMANTQSGLKKMAAEVVDLASLPDQKKTTLAMAIINIELNEGAL